MIPISINSLDPLLPGDIIEIPFDDLYNTLYRDTAPHPHYRSSTPCVKCEVLRVYLASSWEIRYVCKSLNPKFSNEFVLSQILEDLFTHI